MIFDGTNEFMAEPEGSQAQWLAAMYFCDEMETECMMTYKQTQDPAQKVMKDWWEGQAKLCHSRLQRKVPYVERYCPC